MNVQDTPKALIAVEGANHYSITNQDSDRDPTRPTLDQTLATEAFGRYCQLNFG
ncbi:hypothetical protein H6F95_30430 [Cyanobacteria bacterium FACHB-471]|nr:hypothetical protein [Cyanobacteria bacterium FACHB-471]